MKLVPILKLVCILGSSIATLGNRCRPGCINLCCLKCKNIILCRSSMNSDNLLCFNLVFGYHLVLFDVCEEPAMLATLQPTVVGFHMARLRYSIILNIYEVCPKKNYAL